MKKKPKKLKCPECRRSFEPYKGKLPCHGPCALGEKIFVPRPTGKVKFPWPWKRSGKLTEEQIKKAT